MEPKSLAQRLCDIMAECPTIEKRGFNSFHRYKFVREADVADLMRPLLARHGVMLSQTITSIERIPVRNEKGTESTLTRININYELVNADNMDQRISSAQIGEAIDNQDKGVYKASTNAQKYFFIRMFCLGSDEDVEEDRSAGQGKPQATRPQVRPANELPPPRDAKPRYYDLAGVPESKRGDAIEFFEQNGARLDLDTNLYVATGKLQGCDKFEVPAPAHTPEVEIVDKATGEVIPESKLKKETRAKIEKLKGATAA